MSKKRWKLVRGRLSSVFFPCNSRGQVTLFVIVGLLLVLVLILVMTLKQEVIGITPEELVPTEKGKVEQYLSSCISRLGEEALLRLGWQGGYVQVPQQVMQDASVHLRISPFQVVPYWAYGEHTTIPSLVFIKNEIDRYITDNLQSCVFDLQPFQESYDLIEKSSVTADTRISDNRVLFKVHWEVEVRDKAGEKVSELLNHQAQSEVKLKKVHEAATKIVEREMIELKLEDLTQDLIALEHPQLPVAGLEISCSRKVWSVQKAKQTLQELLRVNLGNLKVRGTEIVEFPEQLPYYTNHYVWNLGEDFVQPKVSVVFNYDNTYPFTFQVTPTEGSRMRSGMMGGTELLSKICLQTWKFTYDVQYPVLVRVKDETTGYNFNFAFTVHLHRNIPDRSGVAAPSPYSLPFAGDEEFCGNARIPMRVQTWEAVEGEGVSDAEPLDGVNISLSCIKYRCHAGSTEFNYQRYGYQAVLEQNFPYCVGGAIIGQKPGYKEDFERVVTEAGQTVELHLVPLFSFPTAKIHVLKHAFNGVQQPVGSAEELDSDEMAWLRLTVYRNGEKYHEVEQILGTTEAEVQVGSVTYSSADLQNLSLLAKTDTLYVVDVTLFKKDELLGGYKGNWTLSWEQLQQAEEINFHALTTTGSDEEQFDLLLNLDQYSKYISLPEIK